MVTAADIARVLMQQSPARMASTPFSVSEYPVRGPEMTARQPDLRERVGNAVYDVFGAMGLPSIANRARNDAQTGVDFVPGIGDLIGLDDAATSFGAGNYGTAAAGLGLTALGAVPGVGDAAATGVKKGIRAFHGSPVGNIDEFRTRNPRRGWVQPSFFAVDEGTPRAEQYARGYRPDDGSGAMYEVKIADEGILDARRPDDLAAMRAALDEHAPGGSRRFLDDKPAFQRSGLPGWGDDSLFEALDAAGHKGVVLDERPDVRSIAVFDPSLIEIVKKYGIAGALGAGLITQEMAAQMQQQGMGET